MRDPVPHQIRSTVRDDEIKPTFLWIPAFTLSMVSEDSPATRDCLAGKGLQQRSAFEDGEWRG